MESRPEYLARFLRSCADNADEGVHTINSTLLREAASELERIGPEKGEFKSFGDELQYYLMRAEHYARRAHDILYTGGPSRRNFWFRAAVGRAQSILISLYTKELRRK